jgi:3-phenylpropionate/trans-cinnamate dioxygenase ferredoxin reductase subunit
VTPLRRVVVVGASLAGLRAVEALRRRGFDGEVVVLGGEPHLPYDRPPLSKEVLAGKWDAERTRFRPPENYDELDSEWRLGTRAAGLDLEGRAVLLQGGERVPFDGLVLSCGAAPRRLRGAEGLDGVHVLRSLDDALAIRGALDGGARVAVVGAGFIGAEVAATCRGRGLDVSLIETLPAPLARVLPPALGERMAALHRDHGVRLSCGVPVAGLEGRGRVERVRLADGSAVEADCVVVGIGVVPETGWLEGSGLALEDGVLCDERCAASAPGVVAAGDVARWRNPRLGETLRLEHWTNATEMAEAAAARLLAGESGAAAYLEPYAPVPYFWSDQYGVKIQLAGRAEPGDEMHVVDGSLAEERFAVLFSRAGRLVGALGLGRPRLVMRFKRLLREGASLEEALAAE